MSKLENYYGKFCEDKRLLSRHGQVEYTTSMKYIHKYLKPEDRILDIGAGTGRYSVALSNEGYQVDAIELVKYNLGVLKAKKSNVKAYQGTALDLSRYQDNTFDITLLFGPMYHLFSYEDKLKALDAAIAQIEKQYGKGSVMKLGDNSANMNVETVPTGSLSLDIALGLGGLPKGRIVEVYGPESSGKTTVALHCVAEVQKRGGIAGFIDAEHALDPVYARNIGVDIDNLYISQPDCGEQALEITETMVRSGAVDIVVVDSVAALVPKAEIDGDMGDSHVGLQARLMSQALRKLTAVISKSNCIVIFINQLREKVGVMFGNPETTTGGRALKFYSSVRLDVRRTESLKQAGEIVGNHVRVKVVKNKIAPPFREAEFDIMFGQGISREGDVLDLAVNAGIVNKSGAWYAYEGDKIGQGRENAKTYLHENPAFFDMLEAKVRDFYFTQPEDEEAAVQEDSEKAESEE